MKREREIYVNLDEAVLAATAGIVIGAGAGSSMFLGTPPIEGVKLALTGVPVALIGVGRLITRMQNQKEIEKKLNTEQR